MFIGIIKQIVAWEVFPGFSARHAAKNVFLFSSANVGFV